MDISPRAEAPRDEEEAANVEEEKRRDKSAKKLKSLEIATCDLRLATLVSPDFSIKSQ